MDIKQAASAYNTIANIGQGIFAPDSKTAKTVSPFMDMVNQSLADAVDSGKKAEEVSTLAVMGKADINSLATAVSSAELVLQEVVAIRDKVISAYQQIMQMPL